MQDWLQDFIETYKKLAQSFKTIIVAPSFPVKINDKYFNRAYVFTSKGMAGYQDKFFMTRFENEEWGIHAAPKKLTVFETKHCTFGIQICYDSEFGTGTHHLAQNGVDVLLTPSCTETVRGAARVHTGARARAMEQQLYVVVSQTVGNALWSPAVDINYGYAGFYSTPDKNFPENGILASGQPQAESWLIAELNMDLIPKVRNDGQVLNYKDHLRLSQNFLDEKIEIDKVVID
jgi:predicted amidohydrolase